MAKSKKTPPKVKAKTKGKTARAAVKAKPMVKAGARKGVGRQATKTTGTAAKASAFDNAAVLEYKLFVEDSVRNLEDQVNYYIRKGWSPVGGVVLQNGGHYMQTMVRHQD